MSRRKEIKIRAEVNETENWVSIEKVNKTKSYVFEKINKINKLLARLIKKKKRVQKLLIRNEREDIPVDPMDIKIKENYE